MPCPSRPSSPAATRARQFEIRRRGDLHVARVARDEPHRVARLLRQRGFVGAAAALGAAREAAASTLARERLRRLRQPDAFARDRGLDARIARSLACELDRVARRHRRDGRAPARSGVDGPIDRRRVHERTRRVVNDDDVGRRVDGLERPRHRVLPPCAAAHDPHRLAERPPGTPADRRRHPAGSATTISGTRAVRRERGDAALENRAAADREQLFRRPGGEPAALSARRDDRHDSSPFTVHR